IRASVNSLSGTSLTKSFATSRYFGADSGSALTQKSSVPSNFPNISFVNGSFAFPSCGIMIATHTNRMRWIFIAVSYLPFLVLLREANCVRGGQPPICSRMRFAEKRSCSREILRAASGLVSSVSLRCSCQRRRLRTRRVGNRNARGLGTERLGRERPELHADDARRAWSQGCLARQLAA